MPNETPKLGRGRRLPDFVADVGGQPTRLYGVVGGEPTVVVVGDWPSSWSSPLDFATCAVCPAESELPSHLLHFEDDGTLERALGRGVLLVDHNLRVVETWTLEVGLDEVKGRVAAIEAPNIPPPILVVPRVLEPDACQFLMKVWRRGEHCDVGVERRSDSDGRRVTVRDEVLKRRTDVVVDDAGLLRQLTSSIGGVVLPEVRRAFGFAADRFEGFKLARYDATTEGHFAAHRDNLSPTTAHRMFAMSLLLNSDYHGGELVFPEYSWRGVRPDAGSALLFSCSLLHQVSPVTQGERYVVISFLYADSRH